MRCRLSTSEPAALGFLTRCPGYKSPDNPVCTGLYGVLATSLRQRLTARSTLATCPCLLGNCHQAAPDYPVRHRTIRCASHVPQPTVGRAINAGHVSSATVTRLYLTVRYATELSGVPRDQRLGTVGLTE